MASKQSTKAKKVQPKSKSGEVVLLSGGNPQIAKGYGDAPVKAYIAAMPGWKSDVGRRLDTIIERTVPAFARQSNGTHPSMESRTISGSSVFMSSPNT